MELIFRIHDTDDLRLQQAFETLTKLVRQHDIRCQVVAVSEHLEHCRLGVAPYLPALEISGYIVGKGFELTEERLNDLCSRVAANTKNK